MSFLPEEDQEFLESKRIKYELLSEKGPDGTDRRGVLFPGFAFAGNLRMQKDGALISCEACDVLIMVPSGYATTKLDSFYTLPRLKRPDGADPQAANGETGLFQRTWQFWSRHLDDKEWRAGIDGLRTYLSYIRGELRIA
jgi:hypothetical protein